MGFTDTSDGDLAVDSAGVDTRRTRAEPGDWTWLNQVHSSSVVVVNEPGEHAGATADAAVSAIDDAVLAVQGADCAPVLFWSAEGPFGVAHAGWRGVELGVLQATADALRNLGANDVKALVGPYIHHGLYEFGDDDLSRLESRYGSCVRNTTIEGCPALDMTAMIMAALGQAGVLLDHDLDICTGSSGKHYSHRVRADGGRHCGFAVRKRVRS